MLLTKTYDSWTLERILRHVMYWSSWAIFFILLNSFVKPNTEFWQWAAFELVVLPVKISCAYVIAYFLMPTFLYKERFAEFFIYSSIVLVVWGFFLYILYSRLVYVYFFDWDYDSQFGAEFLYKALELLHITGLVVCIKFYQNNIEKEKANNRLREEKIVAELKYLKNQIQPHFLFNTLNNLYGLVLAKDPKSPDLILQLSDMLGYMLYESNEEHVLLSDEITNITNYISLEKLRYDRKLDLNFDVIGDVNSKLVPPLLLIPFIENAFKHGPAKEEKRSYIDIIITITDHQLITQVKNSYSSSEMDESIMSGIGLPTVRKRLDLLFGDNYNLTIKNENSIFNIELIIPLETQ